MNYRILLKTIYISLFIFILNGCSLNFFDNFYKVSVPQGSIVTDKMIEKLEVGLATVYRVLTQFESAGILEKQNFESGHSVYELASNPDFDEHHDHMVCIKTGKVIEFNNQMIEDIQEKLADSHGYKLIDHKLVLYVEPKKENE